MTSLAKQLQKLAIPGQPSLRQVVSKKRPSLLFDSQAAADIDIDTIHSLGLNGLEELISIDQSFEDYESTLFQDSCKDFERTVQTRDVLEDIDDKISTFLQKLSPYFLLKPAQKCLEWLIRSFRIYSFNVNAIMECILPYHETNLFARVVQLLPIEDPSSPWHWLKPIQKAGSPLSKLTLIQHSISAPSFLIFICDMVIHSLKANRKSSSSSSRVTLAFYSSILIGVLEEPGSISEELVSRLLPYLVKGLKSSNADFRAASYMVVSQLAARSNLEESLYSSLLDIISKHLGPELVTEGVSCMAVICQTQEVKSFSKRTLKHLAKSPTLVTVLSELSRSFYITPMLSCLLLSLLSSHFDNLHDDSSCNHDNNVLLTMIVSILDAIHLEEDTAYGFLRLLIDSFLALRLEEEGEMSSETLKSSVAPLVQSMDAKYPKIVDRAIEDIIASPSQPSDRMEVDDSSENETENHQERIKLIQELISLSLPQSRHQVLMDVNSTLALSVYHHNPTMRAAAVREMGKSFRQSSKKPPSADLEFVSSSLLARLSDDDPTVVAAVLDIRPKDLFKHLPHSELVQSLLNLLKKRRIHKLSSSWQECAVDALSILTSQSLIDHAPEYIDDVITVGIPLLFTGRHSNVFAGRVGEVIGQSALAQTHPVLSGLADILKGKVWKTAVKESTKDPDVLSAGSEAVFGCIGQLLATMETEGAHSLISKLLSALDSITSDTPAYFVLLCVLGSAVSHMTQEKISSQLRLTWFLLEHINQNMAVLEKSSQVSESDVGSLAVVLTPLVLKHPNKNTAHTNILLWVMNIITGTLLIPTNLSTAMWLELPRVSTCDEHLYYHVLLVLFSVLTQRVENGPAVTRLMLQNMNQRHFAKRGTLLRFLAMIWTTPMSGTEPTSNSKEDIPFQFNEFPHSHTRFQVSPILQARSLSIASAYLKSLDGQAALALLANLCPVVPSLLYPLMSTSRAIREASLSCLISLFNATQSTAAGKSLPFFHLVSLLCASQLELTTDPSSLVYLFGRMSEEGSMGKKKQQTKKKDKNVEQTLQLASVEGVLGHVVVFGMPVHIQVVLLRVLASFDHEVKLVAVTSLLTTLLNSEGELTSGNYDNQLVQLTVSTFTPKMSSLLHSHGDSLKLFLKLMRTETLGESSPQSFAISQLTPEFFVALGNQSLMQTILQTLIDIMVDCKRTSVTTLIKQQLVKLPLSADMVHNELTLHSDQLGGNKPPATPSKRPRRTKAPPTTTVASSIDGSDDIPLPWKRVTVILELLQQSLTQVSDCHLLVPDLFNLLNRGLDTDQRVQLEYTQQLLLSTLLEICTLCTRDGVVSARDFLQETQFNVELVVQCVRLSLNPQTHHHALLLLSTAAAIFPARVLHNIMPIFTFMGANILRHDDQYSFQVITKTIDSVIPALIQSGPALFSSSSTSSSSRRQGTKVAPPTTVEGVVKEVTHVFVDALPHVPDHRRLPLFSHLLRTVGVEDYLHMVLGLLLEKVVVQGSNQDESSKEAMVDSSFSQSLAQHFLPTSQLWAMFKLTHYLTQLPQEKPKTVSKVHHLPAAASAMFNIAAHTEKQLKHFKSSTLSLLLSLLTDKDFSSRVVTLTASECPEMEGVVLKLLQTVLAYTISLNKSKSSTPAEETKYWQSMIKKTYSIIDKVISLLSPQAFLDIVYQLVKEDTVAKGDIQRKTLEILNNKLEGNKMKFTTIHEPSMLELVDLLVGVASSDHIPPVTRQTALYGVKLFTKRLAGKHHKQFVKCSRSVLSILTTKDSVHTQVLSSSLLCVAEFCVSLGPHSIPLLPTILPLVLGQLGQAQESSDLLQLSAVTTLGVIVKTLPKFLSSYMNDIITKLCHPSLTSSESVELIKESTAVRKCVSETVPCRVLLPAYIKCYPDVVLYGNKDCVVALLSMLSTTIDHMDKDEVKVHSSLLLDVFITALDYRTTHGSESQLSLDAIDEVETQCLHALSSLVVKLSESLFRPMFIKVMDWATQSTAPKDRLITFYHLADCIAGKLKNLFLLFAGHIVKNVSSLLTTIHKEVQESPFFDTNTDEDMEDLESDQASPETKSSLLLDYVIQCLTKCFIYDKGGSFVTKERFDALLQPLVDQVSNTLGGPVCYSKRIESCLVPCLSHFAVAAGKDSLWKPLNYQLLLKTKHTNPEVRLSVLKVLQEIYVKLGEEFMVLLPETIPFLAECMEDESEDVEKQTQSVVVTIEQILGEPIQQYF